MVSFQITIQVEFNSTLFYDVNGNGVFDAEDLVMRI